MDEMDSKWIRVRLPNRIIKTTLKSGQVRFKAEKGCPQCGDYWCERESMTRKKELKLILPSLKCVTVLNCNSHLEKTFRKSIASHCGYDAQLGANIRACHQNNLYCLCVTTILHIIMYGFICMWWSRPQQKLAQVQQTFKHNKIVRYSRELYAPLQEPF